MKLHKLGRAGQPDRDSTETQTETAPPPARGVSQARYCQVESGREMNTAKKQLHSDMFLCSLVITGG